MLLSPFPAPHFFCSTHTRLDSLTLFSKPHLWTIGCIVNMEKVLSLFLHLYMYIFIYSDILMSRNVLMLTPCFIFVLFSHLKECYIQLPLHSHIIWMQSGLFLFYWYCLHTGTIRRIEPQNIKKSENDLSINFTLAFTVQIDIPFWTVLFTFRTLTSRTIIINNGTWDLMRMTAKLLE